MSTSSSTYVSPFSLHREMGFSKREFFNLLPRPLAGYPSTINEDGALITLVSGTVLIQVGVETERVLSPLVILPILPVRIEFNGVEETDKAKFLFRFDHAFMKGLG